jgi:RNA polymerase sigma factor (sigma-70 family)
MAPAPQDRDLWQRLGGEVYASARANGLEHDDAIDLVQDVMKVLLAKYASRPPQELGPLAGGIAKRLLAHLRAKRARRLRLFANMLTQAQAQARANTPQREQPAQLQALRYAIGTLSPRDHQLIDSAMRGTPTEVIAMQHNLTPASARAALSRAMARLAEQAQSWLDKQN